jgi:glycosyltransferase involved in cell wall biosynthesis
MVSMQRHLLNAWLLAGYQVTVLAPIDAHLRAFVDLPGLTFKHVRHLQPGSMNPWNDLLFYREIKSHLQVIRPQFVFTFTIKPNIYGAHIAGRLGIPCIPTITGLGYSYLVGGYRKQMAFSLYKWAFKRVHAVFFLNESDRQLFNTHGIAEHQRSKVVPGAGVDLEYFRPRRRRSTLPFTFLYVGRLLEHKGIREFVDAARKLRREKLPVKFALVGPLDTYNPSAISPNEIAGWIDEGIVQYYGEVVDVRDYYTACHLLVLPSYREGLSNVVVEALAMERPVIVSDVPGCTDAMDSNCGWVVHARDSEDLAKQMRETFSMEWEQLEQMGKEGRKLVERLFSKAQSSVPYVEAVKDA